MLRGLPGNHSVSFTGGRLRYPCDDLQADISRCGFAYSLSPLRRGRCRVVVRRIGKSMGQKTSVSLRCLAHDREFGVGRL